VDKQPKATAQFRCFGLALRAVRQAKLCRSLTSLESLQAEARRLRGTKLLIGGRSDDSRSGKMHGCPVRSETRSRQKQFVGLREGRELWQFCSSDALYVGHSLIDPWLGPEGPDLPMPRTACAQSRTFLRRLTRPCGLVFFSFAFDSM
jgi:hypothetical protein